MADIPEHLLKRAAERRAALEAQKAAEAGRRRRRARGSGRGRSGER